MHDAAGNDTDFGLLARGEYDQLWLIATDVTGAVTALDVERIVGFRERGGGLLHTRDQRQSHSC